MSLPTDRRLVTSTSPPSSARSRAAAVPRTSWPEFLAGWDWRQGEHVTLLGPTGAGKSTLALQILERRDYVLVFGVKRRDDTLDRFVARGYRVARSWPPPPYPRVVLWPRIDRSQDVARQRDVFAQALRGVYSAGGWCVYLDEVRYLTEFLHLPTLCELLWQQGRSLGVSVVAGTQRPARIPLAAYDQASHLFLWRDSDRRNLRRLSEIGCDSRTVERIVRGLPVHDVLALASRTGKMQTTRVELQSREV